jgi:hypothetical protein
MTRKINILMNQTKKHISALGYLYYMIPDCGSLMLLKEGGDNNHYLMIVFTGRNQTWELQRKHFSIGELYAENLEQIKKGINQYLNQNAVLKS